jgi:hypothetical protein
MVNHATCALHDFSERGFLYQPLALKIQKIMSSSDQLPVYHTDFDDEDGDITLCSNDNPSIRFRTSKFLLKKASKYFKDMFSLKRSPNEDDIVHLDHNAQTVEGLLRMISGMEIPCLKSLDIIEPLLHAAEFYQMPGPISITRELIWSSTEFDPFRLYALACRYEWHELANQASHRTLGFDITSKAVAPYLRKIYDEHLHNLTQLHWTRRKDLRIDLVAHTPFAQITSHCSACSARKPNGEISMLYEYQVYMEMERRPLGDTICTAEFFEAISTDGIKCHGCRYGTGQGSLKVDVSAVLPLLKRYVDALPKTIEDIEC